ncbi:MAG TPA: ion channel, partial [Bacillota bacterium]|nr:ion channel [Bacillota bacterium]
MPRIVWFGIGCVVFILCKSIYDFIKNKPNNEEARLKESSFSMELFYALIILYSTIIIGFGVIYFALSFHTTILIEDGAVEEVSSMGKLIHSMYFSGVTLLTIGYGDIVPIGIGRTIAL